MQKVVIVLACLAYSCSRRVQPSASHSQSSSSEGTASAVLSLKSSWPAHAQGSVDRSRSFAALLLALNPTDAFLPADPAALSHETSPHLLRAPRLVIGRMVAKGKFLERVIMSDSIAGGKNIGDALTSEDIDEYCSDPSHLFEEGSGCDVTMVECDIEEEPTEICEELIPHMAALQSELGEEVESNTTIARDTAVQAEDIDTYCSDPSHLFEEGSGCDLSMVNCDLEGQPSVICEEVIPHMAELLENEKEDGSK